VSTRVFVSGSIQKEYIQVFLSNIFLLKIRLIPYNLTKISRILFYIKKRIFFFSKALIFRLEVLLLRMLARLAGWRDGHFKLNGLVQVGQSDGCAE